MADTNTSLIDVNGLSVFLTNVRSETDQKISDAACQELTTTEVETIFNEVFNQTV